VLEVREIGERELPGWVELRRSFEERTATVEDYLDWKRQADDATWFTAALDGADAGVAVVVLGWHSPPTAARLELNVMPEHRNRGVGSALLTSVGRWSSARGCSELIGSVQEEDAESLAWAGRRAFEEIGRNSLLALDLATTIAPEVAPPAGIAIVTWAERPELERAIYEVACEAYPDVPGDDEGEMAPFERWLAADMQGSGDRPEATFVALAGDDVVGYAKFSISNARPGVAMHDMTGVKRAWRGRGIAGALKRAEIAWAKENGFTRLETMNEERNEPIRRLNERHGYRFEPGDIVVRGPVST
jgi:GNAT superfamily N-acetyltransferase